MDAQVPQWVQVPLHLGHCAVGVGQAHNGGHLGGREHAERHVPERDDGVDCIDQHARVHLLRRVGVRPGLRVRAELLGVHDGYGKVR